MDKKDIYNYSGAIHIHTIHSDGTGNIKQIVKAAKSAGLDWIIITDHNNMDAEEGYIDGVLVIKGEEISPGNKNHYLALGINELILDNDPNIYVKKVREQGGFGFLAHPDESDERKNKYKPIKWLEDDVIPDGIEIWNWFSRWADNYNDSNFLTMAYAYLARNALVTKPCEKTLKRWDDLNKNNEKIFPAIGGLDAHAIRFSSFCPIKIFPYKCMFKKITNYIYLTEPLSKDFNIAKTQVLTAIHAGNNIIVNRQICKYLPKININNKNIIAFSGNIINLDDETFLNINLPEKSDIKVIRNGEEYHKVRIKNYKMKLVEGGKYRIEGTMNDKGYFYTNPINVI